MEANLTCLVYNGEEFAVPSSLLKDKDVFDHVMSHYTWSTVLTEDERTSVNKYLPEEMSEDQKQEVIRMIFNNENFSFGNPIDQTWKKLSAGRLSCEIEPLHEQLTSLKFESYKQNMKQYHIKLLKELLFSTRRLMQNALETGGLDNISHSAATAKKEEWKQTRKRGCIGTISKRSEEKYRKIICDCRQACDLSPDHESSDEDNIAMPTNQFNEEDYLRMLKEHKKKRRMKVFSPELDTRGITMSGVIGIIPSSVQLDNNDSPQSATKHHSHVSATLESTNKKTSHSNSTPSFTARKVTYVPHEVKMKERRKWDGLFEGKGCIYEVYKDPGKLKVDKADPITLDGPLPNGQFTSFFAILKRVFESLNDHKGDVNKITEVVQMYLDSPECRSREWISEQTSWSDLVLSALCYLGAEVGAVSTFDPLPHFYPIVDFRDRIDHWKWLGNKRDSDIELLVLCNHWKANLNRALTVVDYTDYSPLPSLVPSSNTVRSSKSYEVDKFQQLERQRYSIPQKAFTYLVHGYEAAVGPVKGVKGGAVKKEQGSRAREHFLLKSERPNCVTILSLATLGTNKSGWISEVAIRDACSRLPNGEGTRLDICILLKDSQFVADNVTDSQLNNAVSGALDRLHYEKDPCVRYISSKKMWIYLHRNRTEEEFEHISWACEAASKSRKVIMSRIKLTPKILLKESTGNIVDMSPQPGDVSSAAMYGKNKSSPKTPRSPKRSSQKGTSGRAPKTPKTISKRGVKKSPGVQQMAPVKPVVTVTSRNVDSDADMQHTLPMLSTTQLMDEEQATDHSSSEEQISFTTFSGNEEYVKKHEGSSNTSTVTPWLTANTEDYSDSNMSD